MKLVDYEKFGIYNVITKTTIKKSIYTKRYAEKYYHKSKCNSKKFEPSVRQEKGKQAKNKGNNQNQK